MTLAEIITRRAVLGAGALAALGSAILPAAGATAAQTPDAELLAAFQTAHAAFSKLPEERQQFLGKMMTLFAGVEPVERTTVVNVGDLAAESRRAFDEWQDARDAERQADNALEAALSPEQRDLWMKASDAFIHREGIELDFLLAELGRHLPAQAAALGVLADHVIRESFRSHGTCCTPG